MVYLGPFPADGSVTQFALVGPRIAEMVRRYRTGEVLLMAQVAVNGGASVLAH